MKKFLLVFILPLLFLTPNSEAKDLAITPSITLLDFPHPFDLGLEAVFVDTIGIKVSQSVRPSYSRDDMDVKVNDFNVEGRIYPFQNGFFVACAYGHHSFDGNRYETYDGFDTKINATAQANYIMPSIGYKLVFPVGLTLGFQAGWLFTNSGSGTVTTSQDANPLVANNADFQRDRADAQNSVNHYANLGLPSVGLLELGWTF